MTMSSQSTQSDRAFGCRNRNLVRFRSFTGQSATPWNNASPAGLAASRSLVRDNTAAGLGRTDSSSSLAVALTQDPGLVPGAPLPAACAARACRCRRSFSSSLSTPASASSTAPLGRRSRPRSSRV
jgi:hypothetical protein